MSIKGIARDLGAILGGVDEKRYKAAKNSAVDEIMKKVPHGTLPPYVMALLDQGVSYGFARGCAHGCEFMSEVFNIPMSPDNKETLDRMNKKEGETK